MQAVPDAWVSVSATTRSPRAGEVDGVHYQFKTKEQFQQLIDSDGLLEWAVYGSNHYGTPKASVQEHMAAGQQVILEIDVQGAFQIREKVLEQRLRGRDTETEEVIQQRLAAARVELSRKMEYDIQLVNDNLDEAVSQLVSYVNEQAEKTRG